MLLLYRPLAISSPVMIWICRPLSGGFSFDMASISLLWLGFRPTGTLLHPGGQLDRLARHHEIASPEVMDRPRVLHRGIDPCLEHFEDEEVVFRHHPCVGDSA